MGVKKKVTLAISIPEGGIHFYLKDFSCCSVKMLVYDQKWTFAFNSDSGIDLLGEPVFLVILAFPMFIDAIEKNVCSLYYISFQK